MASRDCGAGCGVGLGTSAAVDEVLHDGVAGLWCGLRRRPHALVTSALDERNQRHECDDAQPLRRSRSSRESALGPVRRTLIVPPEWWRR